MYKPPFPGAGAAGAAGGLASTGSPIAWWIAFGVVLLVVGAFLLHATSRRWRTRVRTADKSH